MPGPNDPFDHRPISSTQTRFVLRDLGESASLFEKKVEVFLDDDFGGGSVEERAVYLAECGHVVGFTSAAELVSECSRCHGRLCFRCGNLRCARCLTILCAKCARTYDGAVFCRGCRLIEFGQRVSMGLVSSIHRALSGGG